MVQRYPHNDQLAEEHDLLDGEILILPREKEIFSEQQLRSSDLVFPESNWRIRFNQKDNSGTPSYSIILPSGREIFLPMHSDVIVSQLVNAEYVTDGKHVSTPITGNYPNVIICPQFAVPAIGLTNLEIINYSETAPVKVKCDVPPASSSGVQLRVEKIAAEIGKTMESRPNRGVFQARKGTDLYLDLEINNGNSLSVLSSAIVGSGRDYPEGRNKEELLNEDNLGVNLDQNMIVIADGIGGHGGGHLASSVAVKAALSRPESIRDAFNHANGTVGLLNRVNGQYEKSYVDAVMVGVKFNGDKFEAASVGDSRWIQVRANKIIAQSEIQSVAGALRKANQYTEVEAWKSPMKSIVGSSIGSRYQPKFYQGDLQSGDVLVLFSDGVMLLDQEICDVVTNCAPNGAIEYIRSITARRNLDQQFDYYDGKQSHQLAASRDNMSVAVYSHK